ncbi:SDR family oxidoreductase [Telmatospirillum sp. J64-1]|uniref:SDR family oxidoreductase n=1 Tax=Telmatospirillum sp. J64-1 TaxID=2502183 RepID=UPI00115E402F|nr:SDR family oxidoreductase [Telmatospirillum sp. J64-1]
MGNRPDDKVAVVTGASSGIGRATARTFAEQGTTVILAARRRDGLEEVAAECRSAGGRAMVVPTDVCDERQMHNLARRTVEACGRIDVWVNNAAVSLFGRVEEAPSEAWEQVVRTNLFGYYYGARAVIPTFREQGRGTLINVSSVVGYVAQPYTSAYSASKFAIRGLSESLRQELMDAPGIRVCTVLPATIDTPLFQHAANYTGRAVKAMNPVYPAQMVADAIVSVARKPKREVFVGSVGRMLALQHGMAPGMTEKMMGKMVEQDHLADQPSSRTAGNLSEPMQRWNGVSGGWIAQQSKAGGGSGAKTVAALLLAVGVPLGLYALTRQNRHVSQSAHRQR